jgi:ABC-type phosphate/phosphonate transport system permease subunit
MANNRRRKAATWLEVAIVITIVLMVAVSLAEVMTRG